ncbi:AdoMet-dependent rRNA methyltransferase spb1 [Binucleata daphniae]
MVRKKTGKQRLDKYYHLAKEHGYRARSAFKLLQLNTKYNFLQNCEVLIDLCAAPGGWLQVASQILPHATLIGVDLSPIKPLPNVTTLQCDITTSQCIKEIKRISPNADIVLHDGAPNVGTDWTQDAYVQNELVIHALKLAYEVLKKNGTFITKVFRSKDYSKILYVLQSLFENVEATKPISSREESAEIFVYCKGYKRPNNLDSSFFDPELVFKEVKNDISIASLLKDQKNGYDSFDFYKKISFTDFLTSESLLKRMLTSVKIEFDQKYTKYFDKDIIEMTNDLKLCSLNDLKKLLKKRDRFVKHILNSDESELSELKKMVYKEEVKEVTVEENDEEWKLNKIQEDIKKAKKLVKKKEMNEKIKLAKSKIYDLPDDDFFEDKLFQDNYEESEKEQMKETEEEKINNLNENLDRFDDDCSDSESYDLQNNEIDAIIKMKENEEDFVLSTIDRHCHGVQDNLPDWYIKEEKDMNARIFEDSEEFVDKKTRKKEIEALNRRKKKAKRKVERIIKNENNEDENNDEKVSHKIMKNAYKKTKLKPILVHPRNGKIVAPKTKARIKLVDKRMKKELRAMKKRKR